MPPPPSFVGLGKVREHIYILCICLDMAEFFVCERGGGGLNYPPPPTPSCFNRVNPIYTMFLSRTLGLGGDHVDCSGDLVWVLIFWVPEQSSEVFGALQSSLCSDLASGSLQRLRWIAPETLLDCFGDFTGSLRCPE